MFISKRLIFSFFPLILSSFSVPVQATHAFSQISYNNKDNVITVTEVSSASADSVFIFSDHVSEQDATKTQYPNHLPFPPETPRDNTVVQVLKSSPRFDNKKAPISPNRIQQIFITSSIPEINTPGRYNYYLSPEHLRHEVLRI
ncbi:MAG: hypothetical protein JW915_24835 [Chitinispirillaceae bacterium]|nr:hypothetical protein [Chitinispirillaceae bacterium]